MLLKSTVLLYCVTKKGNVTKIHCVLLYFITKREMLLKSTVLLYFVTKKGNVTKIHCVTIFCNKKGKCY